MRFLILLPFLLLLAGSLAAQQIADPSLIPQVEAPKYPSASGPLILIDQAHHNFHTMSGRFAPFGMLLQADGYKLDSLISKISVEALKGCRVLVISNAIHPDNKEHWALPVLSAFTNDEISALKDWVFQGGSLLLISDHMPFPGATAELGEAFGFTFNNGFAMKTERTWPPSQFDRKSQTLMDHPITNGFDKTEHIDSIATFTGSAFKIPQDAVGLLSFPSGYQTLMPDTAWQFHSDTPKLDIKGWHQGAVMKHGQGKLAVFGEAAMFTAQIAGAQKTKVGFNSTAAPHNQQFILNVIHWLEEP